MTDFKISKSDKTLVITLSERLTVLEVPQLQDSLKKEIADGVREIVFDFSETLHIDSAVICLLIASRNSLEKVGGTLSLREASHNLVGLFKSLRLVEFLGVHPQVKGSVNP
jgi:anti-anti-sigma factor